MGAIISKINWVALVVIVFLLAGQTWVQTDPVVASSGSEAPIEWKIAKSKHFIIHYQENSAKDIGRVKSHAEHYYKSITEYLGFRRFNFWTWENRCKIYLYSDREAYLASTGSVPWARGNVYVVRKEITSYTRETEFYSQVLPHEMGHIIFRELVGFNKTLPLWIDEGVAILQEKSRGKYLVAIRRLAKQGQHIRLNDFVKIKDYDQVKPNIFYGEAASIMHFLINNFSRDTFVSFCRSLRDGVAWQKALLKTYGFKNLEGLEAAWIDSLRVE